MKHHLLCLASLVSLAIPCAADTSQTSHGACSPNILSNPGIVICNVTQYIDKKGTTRALKLVAMELPRNNEDEHDTTAIVDFFDQLQGLDGEIIYLRLSTYVGAGFGIDDVPGNRSIRAGAVFELKPFLDGFGGNWSEYEYGYSVVLKEYRKKWGRNDRSTLLFPKSGNAFFDVHYMKSFSVDGLAKIRLSDMQGSQWVEIVPVQPFGDLMDKYDEIREKLPKNFRHEF